MQFTTGADAGITQGLMHLDVVALSHLFGIVAGDDVLGGYALRARHAPVAE